MSGDILLRQLEYVVALERERHFGRAAASCHASPSALSAAVRKLEASLGVTIVSRGHRFTGFTPEGRRVLAWAHRMLTDRDRLHADLTDMRRAIRATLRLGVVPTADPAVVLLTAALRARHPMTRVRVEVLPAEEITRGLAGFELDAGLTYLYPEAAGGQLTLELYRERYVLLTADDGPFAHRDEVSWAEAAALPLCALTPDMHNRKVLDGAFAAAGAELRPVFEADTVAAIYAHVATGSWSGVVAQPWVATFGAPAGTRAIALADPSPCPVVGLVAPLPVSTLAGALFDAVRRADVGAALGSATAVARGA
ncbi:MAG TPA: LysR family transcriptional regulator [Pseudonocardia sp.]|nr:LysR family transcriptional regulator [Pseudonocardia sp.]